MLEFKGVLHFAMGYPNDEALDAHPLSAYGLEPYQFHLVENSPLVRELDERNKVHDRHIPGSFVVRALGSHVSR